MKVASAGLAGLAAAGVYAFKQFEDSEKVARQTDAVLKSTGNSANVTADQVADLAGALSAKSGIDDEVIQSGENMLLTFTNIKNEAGAGNDVFNQASSTLLDMAASMAAASGGAVDAKATAIQLGKALNNPVEGLSALSRVGVDVAEVQSHMSKAMLAGNDTLGAQKVILAELNKEFGGSAEANKTATGTMSTAFGNLAESVGSVLAPAINAALGVATDFFGVLEAHPTALVAVAAGVGLIAAAMIANNIATAIAAEEGVVYAAMLVARTAATVAGAAATGIMTAAQWAWNAAMTANPIGLVILAVVALVAGIVLLVKHFGLADDIMRVLKATVGVVWGAIKAVVGFVVKAVVGYVKLWINVIQFVIRIVGTLAGIVGRAFMAVFNTVKTWLSRAGDFIRNLWDGIVRFVSGLGSRLARGARGMWDWISSGIKSAVNLAIGALNWLIRAINSALDIHVDLPGPLPDVNFNGPNIPTIPTLDTGGLVAKTGLALVHKGERFSGVGGGFGTTVNVYVQGSVISEHDLADTVQRALVRRKKRSGALGLS